MRGPQTALARFLRYRNVPHRHEGAIELTAETAPVKTVMSRKHDRAVRRRCMKAGTAYVRACRRDFHSSLSRHLSFFGRLFVLERESSTPPAGSARDDRSLRPLVVGEPPAGSRPARTG